MSRPTEGGTVGPPAGDRPVRALVDEVLVASQALVGVAALSLAALEDDVTLPQYRALLVVAEGRASGPGDLAGLLEVHPSNATRLVDRLVDKGLLDRTASTDDRRAVELRLTAEGRQVVGRVLAARRRQLGEILARMAPDEAAAVGRALGRFAEAAGEPADDAWRLGWGS